jgi:ubiquinone/menaquinone biosynthesis C-methylase UbiE
MRRVDPKFYTKKYYLTDATGCGEYKKSFGKILEPRLKRIVQEIPLAKGMKVLDIGCGRGELALWCARSGASEVVGIDYSKSAINLANKARRRAPTPIRNKIDFKLLDAKKLRFKAKSFDAIIMTEFLEHVYHEEQEIIFKKAKRILKDDGFVYFHTAPSRWFNDFTYKYWCYPLSTFLVWISNTLTGKSYENLANPNQIRSKSHKIMHVNEPDYFSLIKLIRNSGFGGDVRSTNITVNKPKYSWKDSLFNFLVYLTPLSNYPPFNILWGNDFYGVLKKVL